MKFFHEKVTGRIRSLELFYDDGKPYVRVSWVIDVDPPLRESIVAVPLKQDVEAVKTEILKKIGEAHLTFKERDEKLFDELCKLIGYRFEIDLTELKEELKRQRDKWHGVQLSMYRLDWTGQDSVHRED